MTDKDKDKDKDKPKVKYDGRKNLIPISSRSPEERAAMGKKGGTKAQEINREKRNAQEIMQYLLNCKITREQAQEKLGNLSKALPDDPTLFDLISLVQVREAQEGSSKAFEVVRDTAGFKPVDQIQTDVNIMSDQDKALLEKVAKRTGVNPDQS